MRSVFENRGGGSQWNIIKNGDRQISLFFDRIDRIDRIFVLLCYFPDESNITQSRLSAGGLEGRAAVGEKLNGP